MRVSYSTILLNSLVTDDIPAIKEFLPPSNNSETSDFVESEPTFSG